jgi:hypothetical protein
MMLMINRRNFLIGMSAVLCNPAIVRISNIMPIRNYEESVCGIRIQSWPLDACRPEYYITGLIGGYNSPRRVLVSEHLPYINKLREHWPNLVYSPIYYSVS